MARIRPADPAPLVRAVQLLSSARTVEDIRTVAIEAARELTGADEAVLVPESGELPLEALSAPIRSLGILAVSWNGRHVPTDRETSRLHALADSAGIACENVRLLAEVRGREEELRSLVEGALDAIVTIDAGGIVREWNPQAEQIFGWSRSEAVGRSMADLIMPPRFRSAHERGLRHYVETGEGPILRKRIELSALRKDGTEFPIELAVVPIASPEGLTFSAFVRDLTERRRSEEESRFLVEASAVLASSLDVQATLAALAKLIVPRLAPSCAIHLDEEPVAREGPESAERSLVVPIRAGGRMVGSIELPSGAGRGMAEELARRAGAAVELSRLYREAQRAIAIRDEFLSIASHELKTPLTALLLDLQAILRAARKGLTPEEAVAWSSQAIEKGGVLTKLLNELLDVSRVRSGKLQLERVDTDLVELVRTVVQRVGRVAEHASRIEVVAEGPVVGKWDRLRLEQITTNLVENAIKYGLGRAIRVEVQAAGPNARLAVEDYGMGISETDLPRLFQPFERAVTLRHHSGFGLGLYIVRQIVEAHGGTIAVRSKPGQGSTFTVELPRTPAARP